MHLRVHLRVSRRQLVVTAGGADGAGLRPLKAARRALSSSGNLNEEYGQRARKDGAAAAGPPSGGSGRDVMRSSLYAAARYARTGSSAAPRSTPRPAAPCARLSSFLPRAL